MASRRRSLERRRRELEDEIARRRSLLETHKRNFYDFEEIIAKKGGELHATLAEQRSRDEAKRNVEETEEEIRKLETELEETKEELRRLEAELAASSREEPDNGPPHSRWQILLLAGCLAVVVFIAIIAGVLTISGVLDSLLAQLRPPTLTPTPTKTPGIALSPTITDTPTLTPTPSPTPMPTPYYVEIVVDASERMSAEFEGGITKMESAWQTAGTIARTRAQKGQFVSIRTFGSGSEQKDIGCFESYSVFSFTDQDSEIKACLTTPPIPCGQSAVVTALTDASAKLMAYENIGREIILLTGGEDGCGSDLSVFYSSENQSLWTQTFVVLFADEDFGPFINLKAQGANINYNLVSNRAEAEAVAKQVANSPPPATPTPIPTPIPTSPAPASGGGPQPAFTPEPPLPPSSGEIATATYTPTPTITQSPTSTRTPTNTPTPKKTATSTPTTTPTIAPTSTPTITPSLSPTIIPTSTPYATPTQVWAPLSSQNDVYAQNCPLIDQTTGFYKFESVQATISANLVSGGHTGQGLRLNFTTLKLDYSYSGWEVVLGDIDNGIDLTSYNSLTFYIRGAAGGETPNVWLMTPIAGGGYQRYYQNVEDHIVGNDRVTTQWQEVVIPLKDFEEGTLPEEEIDLQRINKIQVVFEWYEEPTSGTIYIDDLCVQ